MSNIAITASALPRIMACPASAVLPWEDYHTEHADEGNERHADAEEAVKVGDLSNLPPDLVTLLEDYPTRHTEIAAYYDVATGEAELLPDVKNREYPPMLPPFSIPMTMDLLAIGENSALVVDYKGHEYVGKPEEHAQLMTQALAVARHFGFDTLTIAICYLPTGRVDKVVIDEIEMDVFAGRLRDLNKLVAAARAIPEAYLKTGSHCRWCPAFGACPEQTSLALSVKTDAAWNRVESMLPLHDDKTAADAYEFLARVKLLTKRLSDALYARAGDRPIPLGGGRVFGPHTKYGNEKLDGDKVYEVVKELHGQGVADAAVIRSATKKRLDEALGLLGVPSKAKAVEAVLVEVRARGGAAKEKKTEIEEYTPKLALVDPTAHEATP